MSVAEQCLSTAWSYIEEAEEQMGGLASAVAAQRQSLEGENISLGGSLKSSWKVSREKGRLLQELQLAEKQIEEGYAADPDAVITVNIDGEDLEYDHQRLRAACAYQVGMIHASAGDLRRAESELRRAIGFHESCMLRYVLGLILLDRKRPREAREAFRDAVETGNENEVGIEARKELGRLESRRVFGDHWFVGFWKVILFILAFILIGFAMLFSGENFSTSFGNIVLWSAIMAVYLKFKIR